MRRAAAVLALLALIAAPATGQPGRADEADPLFGTAAELYVFLGASVLALAFITWGTIWLHRDANRRGESAALWSILALVLVPTTFGVGWLVLLAVWLAVRPAEVLCDAHGDALPGMEARLAEKRGLVPPMPNPRGPEAPFFVPSGAAVAPGRERTRCPACAEAFEYVKNPAGLSDVKCPRCGTEGTA